MALAVETPARDDMSLRSNDDRLVGARWLKSDLTPVVIDAAVLTLQFDLPPTEYDPDTGEALPAPDPVLHVIDSTTPGDVDGWIDAANLATGVVLVTIPHTIWAGLEGRTGIWDLVADGEGIRRCLVRGRFACEEGVSL